MKVVDHHISGYVSRIKLNGKKTVFRQRNTKKIMGDGSVGYCLCPSQALVTQCSGSIMMVEAELLSDGLIWFMSSDFAFHMIKDFLG